MNINVTFDNAEQGEGYYIDLVTKVSKETSKNNCDLEVTNIGFAKDKKVAIIYADTMAKEFDCKVCVC